MDRLLSDASQKFTALDRGEMTFEEWWEANADQIRERFDTPLSPERVKPIVKGCWNAAIDESRRWMAAPNDRTEQTDLMANALHVTLINGVMQKNSQ